MRSHDVFDFSGGNVFAFPAEGIASAINKLSVTEANFAHQVTGIEVLITFLEDIGKQAAGVFNAVGITIEWCFIGDLTNQQADLAALDFDHRAFAVADWCFGFFVVFDHGVGHG